MKLFFVFIFVLVFLYGCAGSGSPASSFSKVGEDYGLITDLTDINGKVAFTGGTEQQYVVYYDGIEYGTEYASARSPRGINGKLAYMAAKESGGKEFIVYDGREIGVEYDYVSRPVEIGGQLSYMAQKGGDRYLVVGEEVKVLSHNVEVLFDSARLSDIGGKPAYIAGKLYDQFVIHGDKKIGKSYSSVTELVVSGGKLAYLARQDDTTFLVYDGEELAKDKQYYRASILRDIGGNPAFSGNRDGQTYIWYQGKEYGGEYDSVSIPFDVGGKLVFRGTTAGKYNLVVAGVIIDSYKNPSFPLGVNGELAYVAYDGNKRVIVKEGVVVEEADETRADSFTVIGGKLAYVGAADRTSWGSAVFIED